MNLASVAAQSPDGVVRAMELVGHWLPDPPTPNERPAIDPRDWEWFYLKSLGDRDLRTIDIGHKGYCIALSPDGKRLVSGSDDHTVLIRDLSEIYRAFQ